MFYGNEKHSQSSGDFQDSPGLNLTICEANHLLLYHWTLNKCRGWIIGKLCNLPQNTGEHWAKTPRDINVPRMLFNEKVCRAVHSKYCHFLQFYSSWSEILINFTGHWNIVYWLISWWNSCVFKITHFGNKVLIHPKIQTKPQ